jgi:hypothetical protein
VPGGGLHAAHGLDPSYDIKIKIKMCEP